MTEIPESEVPTELREQFATLTARLRAAESTRRQITAAITAGEPCAIEMDGLTEESATELRAAIDHESLRIHGRPLAWTQRGTAWEFRPDTNTT